MPNTLKLLLQKNSDEVILDNVPIETLRILYTEETGKEGTDARSMLSDLRNLYAQCSSPLIGVHQSFNGLRSLWSTCLYYDNTTFQCFIRNNRNLKKRDILYDDIVYFNMCAKQIARPTFVIHAPYALNPASGDSVKRNNAISIVREDVTLVQKLFGDGYYVLHPGAWTDYDRPLSERILISSMLELSDLRYGTICLETMAGQGTQQMRDLEGIKLILNECPNVNLCVDTCHIWAAGISFDNFLLFACEYKNRIKVIHVNDSQTMFGSHVDRHENIGYGKIPVDALMSFLIELNKMCPDAPMILETPGDRIDESLSILKRTFSKEYGETN